MAPIATSSGSSSLKGQWRPTKIMNMRDLSRDDDFLSHLLVEKLGTGDVPLVVHKMDPTRRLPKTNADELLAIVRRMVVAKGSQPNVIRQAVDDLLRLNAVKYYLKSSIYDQKQVNAFATHASRYFELYLPGGSIEIAHTSRYAHRTGKSELCILATRPLVPGTVLTELKGSMADLTEEEDKELKRTGERHADGVGIRRDFSVIHSKQLKKNHLFLGPARFVNHDCDHNVELFREGRYITFRVIKPIGVGEEVTAHYGDGYFGRKNRHCLCATCERNGRGSYGPQGSDDDVSDAASVSGEEGEEDHDDSSTSSESEDESSDETVNCNERRTRRGVYHVMPDADKDSSTELDHEQDKEDTSDLTSPPLSPVPGVHGLLTPEPELERGRSKGKARETINVPVAPIPVKASASISSAVAFKSVISTRAQKAREASAGASTSRAASQSVARRSVSAARQLVTPPLTVDSAANSVRSSSRLKSRDVAPEEASPASTPMKDRKGKGRATASVSDVRDAEKDEPETRHLRPRISALIFDPTLSKKKPQDAPRGLDGKPLPLCSTCGNILPLISVDSEIVWGLTPGRTGKRGRPKKDLSLECPRCIRHFAIYDRQWPERLPGDGSKLLLPTTRDDLYSKKLANNSLATINRKLNTTASSSKRAHEEEDTRPSKKLRLPVIASKNRPRGRPPKNKVGMSDKARELLKVTKSISTSSSQSDGRRSGRARVPSLKMRESEPPSASKPRVSPRKAAAPPSSSSSLSVESDDAPASIERPTTPPNAPMSPSAIPVIKIVTPKSLAVAAQPRDSNGRFGKKAETNGRFMRTRHFTAASRRLCKGPKTSFLTRRTAESVEDDDEADDFGSDLSEGYDDTRYGPLFGDSFTDPFSQVEFGEEALEDVVLKRSADSPEGQPSKKQRTNEDEAEFSDYSPLPKSSPSFMPIGRGSLLRPNPISFARRKWAPADVEDEDLLPVPKAVKATVTKLTIRLPRPPKDSARESVAQETTIAATTITVVEPKAEPDVTVLDDSDESVTASPPPIRPLQHTARMARLTFRPSPMNLAKRRWAPEAASQSRIAESAVPESVHKPETRTLLPALEVQRTSKKPIKPKAPKFTLAGTELDDDFPFGELELDYLSDSDDAESGQTQAPTGLVQAPRIRPFNSAMGTLDALKRRSASPDVVQAYATDDSEQVVERLLGSRNSSQASLQLRPITAPRSPSPSHPGLLSTARSHNPASPPGYDWKRTVLMPTPVPAMISVPILMPPPLHTHSTSLPAASGHSDILKAGTSSSARDTQRATLDQTGPFLPQRTFSTSSHSPSPLVTPSILAPARFFHPSTGWDSASDDAESP